MSKWIGVLVAVALLGTGGFMLLTDAVEPSSQPPAVSIAPKDAGVVSLPASEGKPAAERRPADATEVRIVAAVKSSDEGVKSVTFDDVKLDLKKGDPYDSTLLTPAVKKLDGKTIRIRGYILPSFQQTGIKNFVLVRDNMECCFGPGALLHDCILVEMLPPASTSFTVRPVSVEGTFSIRELKDPDGKHLAIYHLDGKEVK